MTDESVEWPNIYEAGQSVPHRDNEGLVEAAIEASIPAKFGVLQTLSERKSRPLEWLWQNIIPSSAAVIFAGQGGVSKSTFAITLAGKITRGELPGILSGKPAHVLYVSHEDPIDQVVLPRAQANGVDTSRFHIFGIGWKERGGITMPKFPEDLDELEEKIKEVDAKVVIIDPLLSAMASGRDPNSNIDVRELVDPLNQLAQRLGISIIGIAHINKTVTNARTAVQGSAAWSDATRATLLFAKDERDPGQQYTEVVFGTTKGNYGNDSQNFTYRLWSIDHVHDNGETASVPYVEYLGASTRTVGDVLAAQTDDRREGHLRVEVKDYIDAQPGAVTTKEIQTEFKDQNPATVRMTLTRLVHKGLVDSPERGYYQSMKFVQKKGM